MFVVGRYAGVVDGTRQVVARWKSCPVDPWPGDGKLLAKELSEKTI
jgi:hypothetical protein